MVRLKVMMVLPAVGQCEANPKPKLGMLPSLPPPVTPSLPFPLLANYIPGESIRLVWVLRARTMEVEGTGARKAEVRPRPPTRMQAVRMV